MRPVNNKRHIRHLLFNRRNAEAASALSAPDAETASAHPTPAICKAFALMLVMLLCLVFTSACGDVDPSKTDHFEPGVPKEMAGEWQCDKVASDNETDTSFYALQIDSSGEFSLYDVAAGNPGISGIMGNDTSEAVLCMFNQDDFDPPFCWQLNPEKDTLLYELDGDQLRIGHNDVWLTFSR